MLPENPARILVIISAGLGDFIIAVPALKALRKRFPESGITLLVSSKVFDYAGLCPWVDDVVLFDGFSLLSFSAGVRFMRQLPVLRKLRAGRFDLTLNFYEISTFSGMLKMFALFKAVGAGFSVGRDYRGRGFFFDLKIPERDEFKKNHGDYYADIISALGGEVRPSEKAALWPGKYSIAAVDCFLKGLNLGVGAPRIGINPGGARSSRHWLPERFAEVADFLAGKYGASIIITGGPGEEALAGAVAAAMKHRATVCAGKFSFGDTVELIKRMDLLITTHSSLMHVANAFDVPFVVLAGISDFIKDGPYMAKPGKYAVVFGKAQYDPALKNEDLPSSSMAGITAECVVSAVSEFLDKKSGFVAGKR